MMAKPLVSSQWYNCKPDLRVGDHYSANKHKTKIITLWKSGALLCKYLKEQIIIVIIIIMIILTIWLPKHSPICMHCNQ